MQYLIDNFNIPRENIFNSRNDSFLSDLLLKTKGRGADLVLNSLSGELLHVSWKCVAEFGKLIELGKRDLAGFGKLDMEPFLSNRSYCCIDLADTIRKRPAYIGRLLTRCFEMYKQGSIHPIRPVALFQAFEVEQSFRYLQKGDHIGKAVVVLPEDSSEILSTPQAKSLTLDSEASYLLTGGLGGLGRSVATWMVERGARCLIFLSRSAGLGTDDVAFFAELENMGCVVCPVAGKVQVKEDLEKAILKATKPIKGVVHLAMVLRVSSQPDPSPFIEAC